MSIVIKVYSTLESNKWLGINTAGEGRLGGQE